MKAFGTWVRGELERRKCSSKDVTGAIHDRLTPDSDSPATVTTKFSKLLNGDAEGDRYFMDKDRPDRLSALAEALDRTVDEVMAARARCNSTRTLILDPRLRPEVISALLELGRAPNPGFSCVVVPDGEDVRRMLRDAAEEAENAILVVSNVADVEVFELAKLECSLVDVVPRGFRLRSYPDLIPIAPPRPPRTFDETGAVLVPVAAQVADDPGYYNDKDGIYRRLIGPAIEREETPCLSLRDAISWFTRRRGPLAERGVCWVSAPTFTTKHLLGARDCNTQVWEEAGRVFVVGPRLDGIAQLLHPAHEVQAAPALQTWNEATRNANPWTLTESAAAPEHPLHSMQVALAEWAPVAIEALLNEMATPTATHGRLFSGPEPIDGRDVFRELSRREFQRGAAISAFVLSRAAEASSIVFTCDARNIDVLADMGAGSLLSVRVRRLDSPARGVRPIERAGVYGRGCYTFEALECGDYCVALAPDSDLRLEGPLLPARARRRAEAAAEDSSNDD